MGDSFVGYSEDMIRERMDRAVATRRLASLGVCGVAGLYTLWVRVVSLLCGIMRRLGK